MFKLDSEKAEEPEIKLPTSVRKFFIEKVRKFQKNVYFCFIDYNKAFDCVDHNKLWKILQEILPRDGNTRPPYLPPEKHVYAGQEAVVGTKHGTNGLAQNWERSMFRLYIVTLLN